MYKEPPPGLYIAADENDITKVCSSPEYLLFYNIASGNFSNKAKGVFFSFHECASLDALLLFFFKKNVEFR